MKRNWTKLILSVFFLSVFTYLPAKTYFVSTTGNDNNPGTNESPFLTPNKAVDVVQPGDSIFLRGGTYMLTQGIKLKAKHCARADARIYMWGYPGEKVVIDGSQIATTTEAEFKMARCIYVNHEANYWHFKNLELCNAKDNGMKLEGSYTIVENCKFYRNNDTGLQIGMYKDFKIEETKSLPKGTPEFNPGYQFCKYNIIINCDAYYNYDSKTWNGGKDDGGDADGFAAKLFPGPGTEFHGCRAWQNSDDNWDLYMVYHPIIIDNCWSWKAGYLESGAAGVNGNGFKLGGGGTAGGAAFAQSVGAHVVTNCVAFDCLHKGFDQNNAYEGMYLFNNVSFNNEYNYRFPTIFQYGSMYMRNNIGFNASKENHEFLSADKDGSVVPNTDYNSWTTLDNSSPYKESTKVGKAANKTKDYTSEFKSLSSALFLAERQADGSLPDNDFAKLKAGSVFIDKGQIIKDFIPAAHSPNGLTLPNVTIYYNDASADMGAFESGIASYATLTNNSNNKTQRVYTGTAIQPVTFTWGVAATGVTVNNLPAGLEKVIDNDKKTLTITGIPTAEGTYSVSTTGGNPDVTLEGNVTIATELAATLVHNDKISQVVEQGKFISHIVFTWSGGATGAIVENLPAGLSAYVDANNKIVTIAGLPTAEGTFKIHTTGGDGVITYSGAISIKQPSAILADWYNFQNPEIPDKIAEFLSYNTESLWSNEYAGDGKSSLGTCSTGALQLSKGNGIITLNFPNGVDELKFNWYNTGDRQLTIKYSIDGVEGESYSSGDSKSFKSGNGTIDVVALIPAINVKKHVVVKICNTRSDGGNFNIHDILAVTYADLEPETVDPEGTPTESGYSAIENIQQEMISFDFYQTETGLVVYGDVASLKIFNLSGQIVTQSAMSQFVGTQQLAKGVYVICIVDKMGNKEVKKFVKK